MHLATQMWQNQNTWQFGVKFKALKSFSPGVVASSAQNLLLVNFLGSKISSTEKGVLWLSASLAASGCISVSRPIRALVAGCLPLLLWGLYTQPLRTPPQRLHIYITFKTLSKWSDASCRINCSLYLSFAGAQTRSGPVGPPCGHFKM